MISSLDIYRSAALLIHQHGEEALSVAGEHIEAMKAARDDKGFAVWMRIRAAIEELQDGTVPVGVRLN
ncbi:hypothetical protein [Telmatospirillum sp. J64-1]|uniref:hypothetical protein n=1 Tax=Telmatospirillum sp. J64-1 TaxID=2502183 RepID=UPI00115CD719|nr:hypothetical protein [Telmatospirillum sp. J64-1]